MVQDIYEWCSYDKAEFAPGGAVFASGDAKSADKKKGGGVRIPRCA